MENELNNSREKVSAEKRQILSMKSKIRWLTAGFVILTLLVAGLLGVVYFPDTIQKITNIKISLGNTSTKSAVGTAYLGIEIRDIPKSTTSTSFLSSGTTGVLVSRVSPSSPAAESGIKAGDIILKYNRIRITDTVQFQRLVAESAAGDRVTLVVESNERRRTLSLVLSERPLSQIQLMAGPPSFSQDDDEVEQWGCTLSPLTASLSQKLSIPSDMTGIVVVSVSSSGLAKSAGILPGDLIVSVNQTQIEGMADFYSSIENQKSISLKIFRSGGIIVLAFEQKSALPPLVTIAGSITTAGMPTAGTLTSNTSNLPQIVAIASTGSDLNAPMSLRFGTAPWFIIIDLKTGQYIPLQNTALVELSGYGIIAAKLVASKGAGATIAGSYGLQEYNALLALNITPFVANAGKVLDVFNQYKQSSLSQVTEDSLAGFGYTRSIVTTGGAPFATDDEDDEEEEQSGYKGMPYTLPPQGKYDPTLDPANIAKDTTTTATTNTAQLTAGLVTDPSTDLYLNLNQQSVTCVCPSCGLTYDHPAGVPCSSLVCKACGSRLISLNTGSTSTSSQTLQLSKAISVADNSLPQRVAIAADGNSLSSPVALRFGLANYFIIADLNTGQYTAIQNTAISNTSNYGVIAAQLVSKQGVGSTIAVAYGLPSYYALKTLGINVYTANPGTVSTALSQYRTSSLTQMNVTALPYASSPIQTTAGTSTQRAEYCLCPICQILVPHAPGTSCSDMACPQCGNRLMNADPGSSSVTTTPNQSTDQLPSQTNTSQQINTTQLRSSTYPTQSSTSNTSQTPTSSTQIQTRTNTGIVVAGQPVAGSTSLSTGLLQGSIDGSCVCPACGTTVPHVRGTACSTLACPRCGTAMIGENTSLQVTAGMPTAGAPSIVGQGVSGMPDTAGPPEGMGQSTAGMPTAGMATAGPPEGMGQSTAGMPTAGMATAGPPEGMGQSTAGMPTAGMATAGPPEGMGQSTAGMPTAGMTTAGPPEGMGQSTAGMPTAGMTTAGPPEGMGQSTAGMPTAGMTTAGPPEGMGQSTAGMATLGAPEVVQGVAGLTVAGIPNISTQTVAGITVSGMPDSAGPPEGMGQNTAGTLTAGAPSIVGQGVTGVTIAGMLSAGMPTAGAPTGMGPSATTVAGSNSGKICIAANGDSINSQVADIFDKAPYFLIVGFGSMEVIPNPNVSDKIGSGVQSAQLVVSEGADVVITNDIGIRAIEELHRLQVKVYTGVTGTVKDALAWYQNNRLVPTKLNSSSSSSDSTTISDDEEEQHGPPTSKSKSKGESTTL